MLSSVLEVGITQHFGNLYRIQGRTLPQGIGSNPE
jgi:hypothetical protein